MMRRDKNENSSPPPIRPYPGSSILVAPLLRQRLPLPSLTQSPTDSVSPRHRDEQRIIEVRKANHGFLPLLTSRYTSLAHGWAHLSQ